MTFTFKGVRILISGTYDYVTSHSKSESIIQDYSGNHLGLYEWVPCKHKGLYKRGPEGESDREMWGWKQRS